MCLFVSPLRTDELTAGWTYNQAQEQLVVLQGVAAEKEKAEESAKKAKAEAAKAIEGVYTVLYMLQNVCVGSCISITAAVD